MHELIEDSVYNENVAITIITFTKESIHAIITVKGVIWATVY